jgi:hypothetical protein
MTTPLYRYTAPYRYLSDVYPPEPGEVYYALGKHWVSFSHWIVPGTIPEESDDK